MDIVKNGDIINKGDDVKHEKNNKEKNQKKILKVSRKIKRVCWRSYLESN